MGKADGIYNELVVDILGNGTWDKDNEVRTKWSDGTPAYTKSLISKQLKFDNSEVPILTTKRVPSKKFDDFTIHDFNLINYKYHPTLKMEIAI